MCQILERLKEYIDHKGVSIAAFEKSIGMSNASFSKQLKNKGAIGTDKLENILKTYTDISPTWLITGEGDMLKQTSLPDALKSTNQIISTNKSTEKGTNTFAETPKRLPGAIPLVSEQAVGGFVGMDFSISEHDVLAYYVIPKFQFLGVDFMIEVIGDSMIPKFYPGDIIACSIINHTRYIEWNKCHLIATVDRGLIVKRIMPCSDKEYLTAVSDNKDYPPFDIPKDEITGMARIVGCIHLE